MIILLPFLFRGALVHLAMLPGDVVLFSSLAVYCGRRARAPTADARAWRFALCATCVPAGRLSEADRGRKQVALGLARDPRTGLRRTETTTHPPEGLSFKPRFGHGRHRPPHGVSEGMMALPQWVLRDAAAMRLAGAEAYAPGDEAAAALPPAARLGGAKREARG